MKKEIRDLTPQEMAEILFNDVYRKLPDSTTWMPDFMINDIAREIVISVVTNFVDFHLWNEKKFFYWDEVIKSLKKMNNEQF